MVGKPPGRVGDGCRCLVGVVPGQLDQPPLVVIKGGPRRGYLVEWNDAADQGHAGDPLGYGQGAGQRVGSAGGVPHQRKAVDTQRGDQLLDVCGPVHDAASRRGSRASVAGPIHGDQPDPGCGGGRRIRAEQPRPGRSVKQQRRLSFRLSPHRIAESPAIGQQQIGIDNSRRGPVIHDSHHPPRRDCHRRARELVDGEERARSTRSATRYTTDQPQKRTRRLSSASLESPTHHRRQERATASSCQSPLIPFSRLMPRSCRVTSDPAARSRTVLDRYEGQSGVVAFAIRSSSGPVHRSCVR